MTIDQATGNFTYAPDDINYTAAQADSFTVSVADGKFNLFYLFSPHSDEATIVDGDVQSLPDPAAAHEAQQNA
ncbi:hypothetical protein [Mycobacterium sp. JS623]|uniref:hypothetical protein n=1 Tax=Mycobacterium sp. JS623 TaxID=212767 RepID=UPI00031AEE21|nr:hypothetical protein [Mycobacterium sp. JS623]